MAKRLQKHLRRAMEDAFSRVVEFSHKEVKLGDLEIEFKQMREERAKKVILCSWALQLDKRGNVSQFVLKRHYSRVHGCF